MVKRKLEKTSIGVASANQGPASPAKKAKASLPQTTEASFAEGLFEDQNVQEATRQYAASNPYKHGVLQPLVSDALLRSVLDEIRTRIHFTEKTTDIYRIWQSGDLANLDGLDTTALEQLPALRQLRDAMYSREFRDYLSQVTGSGPLSGSRTDMAVNIYQPGCYLLCHDDVIGTRRVSYILYLTEEWDPAWGGALRLYATEPRDRPDGNGTVRVPVSHHQPEHAIPPGWNQLSFFAVQPGESYHDVEEVYVPTDSDDRAKRTRVAISGWFHLPQPGEAGYVEGMAEQLAQESSLAQLQRADVFVDLPQPSPIAYTAENAGPELSVADLDFLVKFISPQYLTPEAVAAAAEEFELDSALQLPCFLNKKTATRWGEWIKSQTAELAQDMSASREWNTAGPPHKRRYLFQTPPSVPKVETNGHANSSSSPWPDLASLIQSSAFRTYLAILTGLTPTAIDCLLRRFRRGYDYQLAQNYTADEPRLELTLGLTPEKKQRLSNEWWSPPDEEDGDDNSDAEPEANGGSTSSTLPVVNGKSHAKPEVPVKDDNEERSPIEDFGGEEIYMAAENPNDDDAQSDSASEHPSTANAARGMHTQSSSTGAADPAVYRTTRKRRENGGAATIGDGEANDDDDDDEADDSVLQSNAPCWNTMALVLRDCNTLRAVRYVLRHGPADRLDVVADVTLDWAGEGDDEEDDE